MNRTGRQERVTIASKRSSSTWSDGHSGASCSACHVVLVSVNPPASGEEPNIFHLCTATAPHDISFEAAEGKAIALAAGLQGDRMSGRGRCSGCRAPAFSYQSFLGALCGAAIACTVGSRTLRPGQCG